MLMQKFIFINLKKERGDRFNRSPEERGKEYHNDNNHECHCVLEIMERISIISMFRKERFCAMMISDCFFFASMANAISMIVNGPPGWSRPNTAFEHMLEILMNFGILNHMILKLVFYPRYRELFRISYIHIIVQSFLCAQKKQIKIIKKIYRP